jgi:hypothetical protein
MGKRILRVLNVEDAVDHRFDPGPGDCSGDILQSFAAPYRDVPERRPTREQREEIDPRTLGIQEADARDLPARSNGAEISLHLEISVLVIRRSDRIEPYAWQT